MPRPSARLLLLLPTAWLLSGCATSPTALTVPSSRISGTIFGGQQPVTGATLQLYAVGSAADGSPATPLLSPAILTDSGGAFSITGRYTCPSPAAQVYLAGTGGNPGLGSGAANPQLALMAALGPCGSLPAVPFISVNELTTVAAAYALAPYIASPSAVGATPAETPALIAAFTYASQLVNFTTGSAPGTGVPAGLSVPVAQINTIADIVAACINSQGGTAGDSSVCGAFLSLTTPPGASAPRDTVTALANLARNPTLNTPALFNLLPPAPPFQPLLSSAPQNFAINFIPAAEISALTISPAAITFPATAVGFTARAQSILISNTGTGPVNVTGITLGGAGAADFSQTSTCLGLLAQAATCTVNLAYTPSVAGNRSAMLTVASNAPASPQSVAISASAGAPAAGPVSLSVSSLSYTVANTLQDVVLSNYGATPLTIRAVTSTDPTFVVQANNCGTMLPAQSICTISVASIGLQFNGGTGFFQTYNGTLKIDDDAQVGPQLVALSSQNTITLGPQAFSPRGLTTVDFGAWPVGSLITGRQLVATPGAYYTSGSLSVAIGGDNASDFVSTGPTYCTYGMGSTCTFPLTFTPSATGPRTARFLVNATPQYIPLKGTGNPAGPSFTTAFTSSTYSQGAAFINQYGIATVTQTYTLTNNGTTTLNLAFASTGANAASYGATGNCTAVAPKASCSIQITFSSTTVGTFPGAITITDLSTTYSQVLPQTTIASYQVVQVLPSSITFGPQAVGTTSAAQTFTVQGGNVSPAIPLGHSISVSAPASGTFTLPAGSTCPASAISLCTLSVAFAPTTTGPVTQTLTVTDLVSGNLASLQLSGTAGSPAVMLSPGSIVFPARTVGTTSVPTSVTLTNTGSVPLIVSSVGISGAVSGNFTQTNNCSTLAASASCTIAVTFAPGAAGSQAATLNIVSNAAASPSTVALSGTGT